MNCKRCGKPLLKPAEVAHAVRDNGLAFIDERRDVTAHLLGFCSYSCECAYSGAGEIPDAF